MPCISWSINQSVYTRALHRDCFQSCRSRTTALSYFTSFLCSTGCQSVDSTDPKVLAGWVDCVSFVGSDLPCCTSGFVSSPRLFLCSETEHHSHHTVSTGAQLCVCPVPTSLVTDNAIHLVSCLSGLCCFHVVWLWQIWREKPKPAFLG